MDPQTLDSARAMNPTPLVSRLQRLGCPYAPLVQPVSLEGDELGATLVQVLEWLADCIEPEPTAPLLVRSLDSARLDSMSWSQRLHRALSALRFFGLCTPTECKLLTHPAPVASRLDVINQCLLFAEQLLPGSTPPKGEPSLVPSASLSPPSTLHDTAFDSTVDCPSPIPSASIALTSQPQMEQTVAQNCQLIDHIVAGSDLTNLFSPTVTLFPKTWAFIARDNQPEGEPLTLDFLKAIHQDYCSKARHLKTLLAQAKTAASPPIAQSSDAVLARLPSILDDLERYCCAFSTAFDQEFEPWLRNAHVRLAEHEASMDSDLGPAVRQLRTRVDALGQLIAGVESIPDQISTLSNFIQSSSSRSSGGMGAGSVQRAVDQQQLVAQKRHLEQLVTELQNSLGVLAAARV